MAAAVQEKSTESANALATAPAAPAIGYTPELLEPGIAIPGGVFALAFADMDFRRLELQPGLNFGVDATLWAAAKLVPSVQDLMARNVIEEITLEGAGGGPVGILKHEAEPRANNLVLKCRDLSQLETWLQVEERSSVQNSLRRRIKQLKEGVG
jgi:hypothetical protein